MANRTRRISGQEWDIREWGPGNAATTVLLLPGGMCSATFFEDIAAALHGAPVRFVGATLPGFGRTPYPMDVSIENYAALAARLADDVGADIVGGHSLGGNVALEMAAAGQFDGPVLLLSPSFSREDESAALGRLDRVGRVPGIGGLAWAVAMKAMPRAVAKSIPPARRQALVADLAANDARFCRRMVRRYFEYLDRHGSLVPRLCASGVKAVVAFGDNDEVGLTGHERSGLEACPDVALVTIPDATHFMIVEQPGWIAERIVELAGVEARA